MFVETCQSLLHPNQTVYCSQDTETPTQRSWIPLCEKQLLAWAWSLNMRAKCTDEDVKLITLNKINLHNLSFLISFYNGGLRSCTHEQIKYRLFVQIMTDLLHTHSELLKFKVLYLLMCTRL